MNKITKKIFKALSYGVLTGYTVCLVGLINFVFQ